MADVLQNVAAQLAELQQYKERFGGLEEIQDGSETE